MNDLLGYVSDGTIADHWPDLLLAAFLAVIGGLFGIVAWFLKRDIAGMDKRHERAEDKFEVQGQTLNLHETRITVLEKAPSRKSRDD